MFLAAIQDEFGSALFDAEELVNVRVHLVADLFLRLQTHHHELQMFAGEQHLPKVLVLSGCLFDRSKVASHFVFLLAVDFGSLLSSHSSKPGRIPRGLPRG
jgi:hypothetical protein